MNPPSAAGVPLLSGREWKPAYEIEDGNLVELFHNPALACATSYDRVTGYFSANALALAARGIGGMIATLAHAPRRGLHPQSPGGFSYSQGP
jgi:hypothetical protein